MMCRLRNPQILGNTVSFHAPPRRSDRRRGKMPGREKSGSPALVRLSLGRSGRMTDSSARSHLGPGRSAVNVPFDRIEPRLTLVGTCNSSMHLSAPPAPPAWPCVPRLVLDPIGHARLPIILWNCPVVPLLALLQIALLSHPGRDLLLPPILGLTEEEAAEGSRKIQMRPLAPRGPARLES